MKPPQAFRPPYPRSRVALQGLRETLDRYNAAKANLKANDARRQGAKNLADELSRLNKIEADDFRPRHANKCWAA